MSAHHILQGFTAAEANQADILFAAHQNIANTGAESFYTMSARNAAAAEAYRAYVNSVGQRLYAAPGVHDNGMNPGA